MAKKYIYKVRVKHKRSCLPGCLVTAASIAVVITAIVALIIGLLH